MTDPLSPNQLENLLPALRHVAELVQKSGAPSREDLQLLLIASGLDEDWAIDELQRWAKVLVAIRGVTDTGRRDIAQRALMLRGIPEAPAKLAVETTAASAPAPPSQQTTLPIQVSREAIGFGELEQGQEAQETLTVSGGPGRLKVGSDTVTVQPETFGPNETTLTVTVKGGVDGQVLWDALTLESETESVKVDLTARWTAPVEVVEGPVVVTPIKIPQFQVKRWVSVERPREPQVKQTPKLQVKPQTIDFGEVESGEKMPSRAIEVQNVGDGELQWQAKTDAQWLNLTEQHDKLVVQLMDVVGTHEGKIEIESNGGMATISIRTNVIKVIPEQLSRLINDLKDGNPEVRKKATEALGQLGDTRTVEPLINALKDKGKFIHKSAAKALGQLGDTRAVEPLINALKSANENEREYAAKALCQLGEPAVEPLINALKDKHMWVVQGAAEALGQLGDTRAVEPLINALKYKNAEIRTAAAIALGRLGDTRAIQPLINALTGGSWVTKLVNKGDYYERRVRECAAEALGQLGNTMAVEPLINALKEKDVEIRVAATKALGQLGDKRAVDPLINALKEKRSKSILDRRLVPMSAAGSLGKLGDKRAVEPLINALKDEDKWIRACAAEALGNLGDKGAIEPLINALKDESSGDVCAAISQALKKIREG